MLPLLVERLRPLLDGMGTTYEVVAVDDGSTDLTAALLQRYHREWPQLRVVRLRANAGHQAAISAGLVSALGDYVVTIDADLQDPPEIIPQMLAAAKDDGVDVVYGVRNDRSTDTWFKRASAPGVLQAHRPHVADLGPRRRRRLPAHVARHRRRDQQPPRAQPRPALHRAGPQLPVRHGRVQARGAGGRGLEVPAAQDDQALARLADRLLDGAAAARDVRRLRRCRPRRAARPLHADLPVAGPHRRRLDLDRRHRRGRRGGPARLRRHPRRVHRPDVRPHAGPPDLLHRLRLDDGRHRRARSDGHSAAGSAQRGAHPHDDGRVGARHRDAAPPDGRRHAPAGAAATPERTQPERRRSALSCAAEPARAG